MLDAIALGELLIDFATVDTDRDGYPTLAAHPGGAPGNFLAALHAYGCSGAMLGKVGADTFGDLLCTTLAQAGIRTEGIVRDPSVFTTLAFVTFGPGGERAFSFARKPGADHCRLYCQRPCQRQKYMPEEAVILSYGRVRWGEYYRPKYPSIQYRRAL